MKTLKELQGQIEELQREKETLTTLCEFIPEKLAVFFKPAYLSSGYSMREKIVYTCNGKELLVVDNRECYAGRGRKYTPTHGYIKVDFTKKDLKEYCTILKEMDSLEYNSKILKNKRSSIQNELQFIEANNGNTENLEKKLTEVQSMISKRNEEFFEKGGAFKRLILMRINYKESKIKDLICTAF